MLNSRCKREIKGLICRRLSFKEVQAGIFKWRVSNPIAMTVNSVLDI
jgi:hypothetical protein